MMIADTPVLAGIGRTAMAPRTVAIASATPAPGLTTTAGGGVSVAIAENETDAAVAR